MTTAEIAAAVAGTTAGPGGIEVTGPAFVDSRKPEPGGLFVAVPGEHVDGHAFAVEAIDAGAAAVLSQRPVAAPGVVVADCVHAIGLLAHHVVSRLTAATVVGITGSQGKTTSKDILAQLLEADGETVAAVGSLNNEIGVPLTTLRATEATRYLVVEMGARGLGHIRHLAAMVRPQIAVVLNVGVAHLGEYASRLDIARAKAELVDTLPPDGVAVLNADDPLVADMRHRTAGRVVAFGRDSGADVRIHDVHLDDAGHVAFGLSYEGADRELTVRLVGQHHASNAAAAAAAALACGMPFDRVCDRLAEISPRSGWRMEMTTTRGGVVVINDAYNANPDSMRAALTTLADLGRRHEGRTFAVLGEMRELGAAGRDEHEAVGRFLARLGIARLVAVGETADAIRFGASQEGSWKGESVCLPDRTAATGYLRHEVEAGDLVLVKGSRAAGLEAVALDLLHDPVTDR